MPASRRKQPRLRSTQLAGRALIFAALGDPTRLALLGTLASGTPRSISQLAEGSTLTRQAITKHLRVLEGAGVVASVRVGRESLFEFRAEPLREAQRYLDEVASLWDDALGRLRAYLGE